MWLNLADLIHHSVPDRKGNALPADVTSGTYDLEDLEPGLGGNLIEGKVALDKTWGHLTYGCLTCCGYSTPYLMLDPTLVGVGGGGSIYPYGANNCTGVSTSLNSYFSSTGKWWSGNTGIAQVTAFRGTGVAPGTTNGYASATVPSGDGGVPKPPCPQVTQEGANNVTVKPTITGPNTVWWFGGQNPSGYATSITLSSSGGASTSWAVTNGSSMITLSATTGSSVNVSSTGTAFSSTATDIAVTATANGVSSAPFYITSRRPYRLVAGTIIDNCDSTWGYSDFFNYTIEDQMNTALPSGVPLNELWTTVLVNDYPNTNWRQSTQGNFTTSAAAFADNIQGENVNLPPRPPTACPSAGQAVDHWGQAWYIGSLIAGSGARVQTDTIQKYTNDAQVQGIASPAP